MSAPEFDLVAEAQAARAEMNRMLREAGIPRGAREAALREFDAIASPLSGFADRARTVAEYKAGLAVIAAARRAVG